MRVLEGGYLFPECCGDLGFIKREWNFALQQVKMEPKGGNDQEARP